MKRKAVWEMHLVINPVVSEWNFNAREELFNYITMRTKVCLFPLTLPTLSKSVDWTFYIGTLPSLFFFFSFSSKFVLLKIPYFRFVSPKDRYFRITEHIFVVKERKNPTYLPTSKIVGRVRGNRNIFNCGLRPTCSHTM